VEEVPNTTQLKQQSSDMQELKRNTIKGLFKQMGTMLNLLT
jgi:hypothetical protein